jgi:uncharacterized Zn finger protein
MTGETVDGKARRLLALGAVTVVMASVDRTVAHVRGDSGVYDVEWDRDRGWSCTCPNFGDCSHRRAVRLCTTAAKVSS